MSTSLSPKFQEFSLSDIFSIATGSAVPSKKLIAGSTPRIAAGNYDQGITGFFAAPSFDSNISLFDVAPPSSNSLSPNFSHHTVSKYRTFSNFISVSFLGAVFYHPYTASLDLKVHALTPRDFIFDQCTALYIVTILRRQFTHASYRTQISKTDLINSKIYLPVDASGRPNWQFMHDSIQKTMQKNQLELTSNPNLKLKLESKSSADSKLDSALIQKSAAMLKPASKSSAQLDLLTPTSWQDFLLTDIFSIKAVKRGLDQKHLLSLPGSYPYITRNNRRNGYAGFIAEQKNYPINPGNVITIGLDTGSVFYQPAPFYSGQNIQILTCPELNVENALFLVTLLKQIMRKFNWGGNGATLGRLKRCIIKLPVDQARQPDWQFMTQFIAECKKSLVH